MATQISPSVLCGEKFHFQKSFIYGSVLLVGKFHLLENFICSKHLFVEMFYSNLAKWMCQVYRKEVLLLAPHWKNWKTEKKKLENWRKKKENWEIETLRIKMFKFLGNPASRKIKGKMKDVKLHLYFVFLFLMELN